MFIYKFWLNNLTHVENRHDSPSEKWQVLLHNCVQNIITAFQLSGFKLLVLEIKLALFRQISLKRSSTWEYWVVLPWHGRASCRCTAPVRKPSCLFPRADCPVWEPEKSARPSSAASKALSAQGHPAKKDPNSLLKGYQHIELSRAKK